MSELKLLALTGVRFPPDAPEPVTYDPRRPWRTKLYPTELHPLLAPPGVDLWPLARVTEVIDSDRDFESWSTNPAMRGQSKALTRLWMFLGYHYDHWHERGWGALTAELEAMPRPSLPDPMLRLLPPQALEGLKELWWTYFTGLLRELWARVPEDPRQDWRVLGIVPPFPVPDPAPVPPPQVEPAPDLWLAWSRSSQGAQEKPLLIRSVQAPRPLDVPELRHSVNGGSIAPSLTGTPVALDYEGTTPIIRALYHHQEGVWEEAGSGA